VTELRTGAIFARKRVDLRNADVRVAGEKARLHHGYWANVRNTRSVPGAEGKNGAIIPRRQCPRHHGRSWLSACPHTVLLGRTI